MKKNRYTWVVSSTTACPCYLHRLIKEVLLFHRIFLMNLPVIKGDRTKLMQVILNVLKNSIEAIDIYAVEKSISINITSHTDFLILQIQDSGKGFDEATGKKLFTRGFTTKSSGTGLGLTVAEQ